MNAADEKIGTGAREMDRAFWAGFSLAMLITLAALNVFVLLFVVPKFEQIFADALPGKPLPAATNFIIGYRALLIGVITAWSVFCVFLRCWKRPYAILWINLGIILFLLEIAFTLVALFMPMVGTTDGLPTTGR